MTKAKTVDQKQCLNTPEVTPSVPLHLKSHFTTFEVALYYI